MASLHTSIPKASMTPPTPRSNGNDEDSKVLSDTFVITPQSNLLSEGSFGRIYKLSPKYVIKVYKSLCKPKEEGADKSTFINEDGIPIDILREIAILRSIDHPNVVKFIKMLNVEGSPYERSGLVLEYIDGGCLTTSAFQNFTPDKRSRAIISLLDGMAYLHSIGVIHRDIKSNNVLVTKDGICKLADFGCSTVFRKRGMYAANFTDWVTTREYRAPETYYVNTDRVPAFMIGGEEIDVWSLGVLLYELLTDKYPFRVVDTDGKPRTDLATLVSIFSVVGFPTREHLPMLYANLKPGSVPWFDSQRDWVERFPDPTAPKSTSPEFFEPCFIPENGIQDIPLKAIKNIIVNHCLVLEPTRRKSITDIQRLLKIAYNVPISDAVQPFAQVQAQANAQMSPMQIQQAALSAAAASGRARESIAEWIYQASTLPAYKGMCSDSDLYQVACSLWDRLLADRGRGKYIVSMIHNKSPIIMSIMIAIISIADKMCHVYDIRNESILVVSRFIRAYRLPNWKGQSLMGRTDIVIDSMSMEKELLEDVFKWSIIPRPIPLMYQTPATRMSQIYKLIVDISCGLGLSYLKEKVVADNAEWLDRVLANESKQPLLATKQYDQIESRFASPSHPEDLLRVIKYIKATHANHRNIFMIAHPLAYNVIASQANDIQDLLVEQYISNNGMVF